VPVEALKPLLIFLVEIVFNKFLRSARAAAQEETNSNGDAGTMKESQGEGQRTVQSASLPKHCIHKLMN